MNRISASTPSSGSVLTPLRRIISKPSKGLLLFCLFQLLVWTLVPGLVDKTPPDDALEEFLWSRQWMLLTYKHPQFPAWATGVMYHLTGSYIWSGYLLCQLAICITFVMVYLLGRDIMGNRAALAGVMLLPVTGFFSEGTRQFNHDIAQMPFWAAICWLLWRAIREQKTLWWVLLGIVSGCSVYAKFSTGVIMAFGGLWILYDPAARRQLATKGPWIGLGIMVLLSLPLVHGLIRDHFIQLTYATDRDGWVLENRGRLYYIGVQAALLAGLPLALWSSGLLRFKRETTPSSSVLLDDRSALWYLTWMGLGPALLLCLASLFTGVGEAWGKPMYNLIGLVAIAWLGQRLTDGAMKRVAIWGFSMILATALLHTTVVTVKCELGSHPRRICMPSSAIAARLQDDWHKAVNAPLGIVAGDEFWMRVAGALSSDRPSMFTDFSFSEAPWITPDRLRRQGMLVVWADLPPPPEALAWIKGYPVQQEHFEWQAGRPPVTVHYVIIPPGALKDIP
ncbi:glycosyltransferase family 39 protein [Allorhizobium sp. BGMRC 0089]|uniref:glycosyltransferase family 39 protein n=1 Tax=Allorhizobium sonneratiae TaxID=2934936 RepID=UPI00203347E3|nr:glycosyltransferase family 39 protein [Allorhizobium sonneratiae]MCM2294286.1 glycosyltransferase family 39 protein [Allorhizobium sonneratiae]